MALALGVNVIRNGDPLKMGTVQIDKMMIGTNQVWVNQYVATAPTSFTASITSTSSINFTWVLPIEQGQPVCTYEVRDALNAVVATAVAGATSATYVTTVSVYDTFHVVAVNVAGDSPLSNTDTGTSYVGAVSPYTITTTGQSAIAGTDFPAGVTLTINMCGGGGAGAAQSNITLRVGGGFRGVILADQSKTYAGGTSITPTIGVGGAGRTTYGLGEDGTATIFDDLTAAGGRGGHQTADGSDYDYQGEGAAFVSPLNGITYYDGENNIATYSNFGGQAGGYGDGGDTNPPTAGGIGAGGGSSGGVTGNSASGGRGQIVISW